ncbi:hypothetical protein [Nevskia sp.]|uniref:hypothetical protein n=1 Tax=Nevskia sp. TaxID=1929292 RepID=UPI0025CE8753|nr:hypothetical protein [Nevskia sp.]
MNETDQDFLADWPVTPDGWQVVDLGRSLFPGGPGACRVASPNGIFYFGLSFDPPVEPRSVITAVVTSFGRSSIQLPYHSVLNISAVLNAAQMHVQDYLSSYPKLFYYTAFHRIEFRSGDDRQFDIF